jgi:hypothetical protein
VDESVVPLSQLFEHIKEWAAAVSDGDFSAARDLCGQLPVGTSRGNGRQPLAASIRRKRRKNTRRPSV